MNESKSSTRNYVPQPYCPPRRDPLKESLIAVASLRLHLRRHRREAGPHQLVVINRLLDASDAFARSIERLRGAAVTTSCGLAELEQFALDSQPIPDAVEVVAQ